MSARLTHILRRVREPAGQYIAKLSCGGAVADMTPDAMKAQRMTRDDAEAFQRQAAGWFEAVPVLRVITAPRVWGSKEHQEIHR